MWPWSPRECRNGHIESETPLHYAGQQNTYAGTIPVSTTGKMELEILAMDPPNANFGIFRQDLTVTD
jgi:hypothetical protein